MKWTIESIKKADRDAGRFYFSPGSMRFFHSRAGEQVYQGKGGVFFVTSEQLDSKSPRKYIVRQFTPEPVNIFTVGPFNRLSRSKAHTAAKKLAAGRIQTIAE